MNSVIRVAELSDIAYIIPLWDEFMVNHENKLPYLKADEKRQISVKNNIGKRIKEPNYHFLVSEVGHELAGFISCHIIEPTHIVPEKVGYITETIVKEAYKRNGIGTRLFMAAREWLFEKGANIIEGRVAIKNEEAATFWHKMGFTPTFHQMTYRIDY